MPSGGSFSPDAGQSLTTSLIAYYKLEEASGTRVDSFGANDLADNFTVTQAVGKVGNAGQFTRVNSEYLSIADNAALSVGDEDFTIVAWVYLDSTGITQYIAAKSLTGNNAGWWLNVLSSNVFGLNTASGAAQQNFSHSLSLSSATWYFVVAWYDSVANTLNIQVNNGTPESTAQTLTIVDNAEQFVLGTYSGADSVFWNGRIDEVGFWKKVLTAQERTDLYNSGNGNTYDPNTPYPAKGYHMML